MADKPIKVLVVEDDSIMTASLRRTLSREKHRSFEVVCADRLSTGLEHLAAGGIDVVLLDLMLPDSQRLDTLAEVLAHAPEVPIVVLTGLDDEVLAIEGVRMGAQDYLIKKRLENRMLVHALCYAVQRHRLFRALEQKTLELQASEKRFRTIISENADGIIIVDRDGIVRFVNPAAERLFGHKAEQLLGEWFGFPVVAGETAEVDIVRKGGETIPTEMRVAAIQWEGEIAYLASLRDITERKKADRLKAIMELAVTVNHELNQPLGAIQGNAELLLSDMEESDLRYEQLTAILKSTERAAELVRKICGISEYKTKTYLKSVQMIDLDRSSSTQDSE